MVVRSNSRRSGARRTWWHAAVAVTLLGGAFGVVPTLSVAAATPQPAQTSAAAPSQNTTATHETLSAAAIAACGNDASFLRVAGQGPLCQADRSFVLGLQSGRKMTVAPPDTIAALGAGTRNLPHATAPLLSEQCVPSGTPRVELFYAHFAGQTDNLTAHVADIQQMFRDVDANYIAYDAATYWGLNMHLNVECDSSGNPVVHDVALSTPLSGSDFSTIASDMQNQGYDQSDVHYWIWTDGNPVAAYGYAGQSTIQEDDSAGASNSINTQYEYSVNYGYTDSAYGPQVFAHENGHAMGAVQLSAPDSTGAFHCTDGLDVMCYNDGGPHGNSYTAADCADTGNGTALFDCHRNDYFNPSPAAGSYLATHWNLGSPNNHWIYLGPMPTSTSLAASNVSTVYSQPLTLTASVSSLIGPASGGTVTFLDNGGSIGTAPLNNGQAQLTTTSLALGQHTLTASFGGAGSLQSSGSGSLTDTVSEATSGLSLASSANPAGLNLPFTLSATVRPVAPATAAPTGTVTFYEGSNAVATASLSNGVATYTTALQRGTYAYWASYAGDGNFTASDDSASQLQQIVLYAASDSVQTSSSTSSVGVSVQFTANVGPGSGTPGGTAAPTGTVQFEDGSTPISGKIAVSSNSVTFSIANLAPGAHTIAAVYSGDGVYAPAIATVQQTVKNWNGFYELDGFGGVHALNSASLTSTATWPNWDIARGIAMDTSGAGGVVLDGWGGLHPFGDASNVHNTFYWPGWDINAAVASNNQNQGYVLDGFGGLHPFSMNGAALPAAAHPTAYWGGWYIASGVALFSDNSGGVVLDGWGGVHPFSIGSAATPAPAQVTGYWFDWDIARSIVLLPGSTSQHYGGYVLDGWGGLHPFGTAGDVPPPLTTSAYWYNWDIARAVVLLPGSYSVGYVLDGWGGMHPVGGAPAVTDPGYTPGAYLSRGAAVR